MPRLDSFSKNSLGPEKLKKKLGWLKKDNLMKMKFIS